MFERGDDAKVAAFDGARKWRAVRIALCFCNAFSNREYERDATGGGDGDSTDVATRATTPAFLTASSPPPVFATIAAIAGGVDSAIAFTFILPFFFVFVFFLFRRAVSSRVAQWQESDVGSAWAGCCCSTGSVVCLSSASSTIA